jgi:hypothetical protein
MCGCGTLLPHRRCNGVQGTVLEQALLSRREDVLLLLLLLFPVC